MILNAGYLGSLFWGATFLVLGERRTRARTVIASRRRLHARGDARLRPHAGSACCYGLGTAPSLLLGVASRLKPAVSEILLAAIGATSCPLRGVGRGLRRAAAATPAESDAAALARLTGIPALWSWGVVWIALSIVGARVGVLRQAGLTRAARARHDRARPVTHEGRRCLAYRRPTAAAVQSRVGSDESDEPLRGEAESLRMKRIGILTAGATRPPERLDRRGGPAGNQYRVEVFGIIKGCGLLNPRSPTST